ncbi:MAG TPA: hypothetical protein VKR41_09280, partial [Puia sp.]|nr:hypothetical protein [Puia sp.]
NQLLFDSVVARGVRARTEMYDRPSPYRAPLPPANIVRPGVVNPGAVRPGLITTSFARRQDSVMRAMRAKQAKRDTTGRAKGRP